MKREGRKFENEISNILNKINKMGKGFFIKSPTPMKLIEKNETKVPIYANKSLCDFIGIYKGKFIIIEAKNILTNRFEFSRLKEHQEKQLASIKRYGGISFILFKIKEEIIFMEIEKYLIYKKQSNKKSINIKELEEIGTKIKLEEIDQVIDKKINY